MQERLFREMITTKGKHGTGLGLYMSYSTIKGMFRGDLLFSSAPGKGTVFTIVLPAVRRSREKAQSLFAQKHFSQGEILRNI